MLSKPQKANDYNKYYFIQQRTNTCHICCWYNLNLLKNNRVTKTRHIMDMYYTYSLESILKLSLSHVMCRFNTSLMKEFMNRLMDQGIILPYLYNKNGSSVFYQYGIQGPFLFSLIPMSALNYKAIHNIGFNIFGNYMSLDQLLTMPKLSIEFPCYIQYNMKWIYNLEKKRFEPFSNVTQLQKYYGPYAQIKHYGQVTSEGTLCDLYLILLGGNCIYLYIPANNRGKKKIYGWQMINNNKGTAIECDDMSLVGHGTSVLFWTMFMLGVDTSNNIIDEKHEFNRYYQSCKTLLKTDIFAHLNVFNMDICKKENVFQYHLANIIKKNPLFGHNIELILLEHSKCPIWDIYRSMDNFYNKKGIQLKNTEYKKFILGPEQMLSYIIGIVINLLWKGSISIDALSKTTHIPKVLCYPFWCFLIDFVMAKNKNGYSMLDIIRLIPQELKRETNIDEFVLISSHCCVISYKEDLINLQLRAGINCHNPHILKFLPCIIDSSEGEPMKNHIFYSVPS